MGIPVFAPAKKPLGEVRKAKCCRTALKPRTVVRGTIDSHMPPGLVA